MNQCDYLNATPKPYKKQLKGKLSWRLGICGDLLSSSSVEFIFGQIFIIILCIFTLHKLPNRLNKLMRWSRVPNLFFSNWSLSNHSSGIQQNTKNQVLQKKKDGVFLIISFSVKQILPVSFVWSQLWDYIHILKFRQFHKFQSLCSSKFSWIWGICKCGSLPIW